jgi:hypothetical protein
MTIKTTIDLTIDELAELVTALPRESVLRARLDAEHVRLCLHDVTPTEEAPAPKLRGRCKAKVDSTNSRGIGTKEYRLAVVDGRTYWVDQAPGAIRLDDGYVELDAGTIIISIDQAITRSGKKTTYFAGIIVPGGKVKKEDGSSGPAIIWEGDEWCPVEHVGTKPGNVHVLKTKATGERFEVSP